MSPTRIAQFKLSLLVSLGLVPACGGSTLEPGAPPAAGSGGATNVSGANATAGTASNVGASSSVGATANTGGTSTAGMSSTGGQPVQIVPCTSPTTDPVTGVVSCEEGFSHRPRAVTCGTVGGPNEKVRPPDLLPRTDGSVSCVDGPSVCDGFQYGYCETFPNNPELSRCQSGCAVDRDCGEGNICVCGDAQSPTSGVCRPSTCATDAECQPGYFCATYTGTCGAIFDTDPLRRDYACQMPEDECVSDADCVASGAGSQCTWYAEGRVCGDPNPACGRPFLVEARARLAPMVASGAWTKAGALQPNVSVLSAAERAAQAEHWTKLGLMEHASIAAFARFSLQLLSLGAPPELVEACTQALADETAHTKLCFQLASAYAGQSIGPGRLDVERSLELSSLADIVDLVIVEGCFGETRAALEALDAAEAATDPVIAAAYAQIADDEQRHAELAFQFVKWALIQNESAVRERITAALGSALTGDDVARAVTAPCLRALLSAQPTAQAPAQA